MPQELNTSAVLDEMKMGYDSYQITMAEKAVQDRSTQDDLEIFRLVFQIFDKKHTGFITLEDMLNITEIYMNQNAKEIYDIINEL
jgi:Ca2+-binding EF-hand superfamily protein